MFKLNKQIEGTKNFLFSKILNIYLLLFFLFSFINTAKIDTNKLISSGAISIEKVVEYDENILKAENKAVVKNSYYKIVLKKTAIGDANIARSYVDALTNLVIKENISKAESMDYTADLISFDESNRYDTQIEYLQNQFNLIINGYKSLKEGQIVDFTLIETAKGSQAINVKEVDMQLYKYTKYVYFFILYSFL